MVKSAISICHNMSRQSFELQSARFCFVIIQCVHDHEIELKFNLFIVLPFKGSVYLP